MDKKEEAIKMHDKKYNCCQAVACAFADEVGVDKQILFMAGEGFGGGLGCTEGLCGALMGAVILAGFLNSDGDLEDPSTKKDTYRFSSKLYSEFKERTGAVVCKDIKGVGTGKVLCSCENCIRNGVDIVQEVLHL